MHSWNKGVNINYAFTKSTLNCSTIRHQQTKWKHFNSSTHYPCLNFLLFSFGVNAQQSLLWLWRNFQSFVAQILLDNHCLKPLTKTYEFRLWITEYNVHFSLSYSYYFQSWPFFGDLNTEWSNAIWLITFNRAFNLKLWNIKILCRFMFGQMKTSFPLGLCQSLTATIQNACHLRFHTFHFKSIKWHSMYVVSNLLKIETHSFNIHFYRVEVLRNRIFDCFDNFGMFKMKPGQTFSFWKRFASIGSCLKAALPWNLY